MGPALEGAGRSAVVNRVGSSSDRGFEARGSAVRHSCQECRSVIGAGCCPCPRRVGSRVGQTGIALPGAGAGGFRSGERGIQVCRLEGWPPAGRWDVSRETSGAAR